MNVVHRTEFGTLRLCDRDGCLLWQLQCPGCSIWADLDSDQLHGRVSVECPNCTYHETHDFSTAEEVA